MAGHLAASVTQSVGVTVGRRPGILRFAKRFDHRNGGRICPLDFLFSVDVADGKTLSFILAHDYLC